MECGKTIRQKAAVKKCKKCTMDLCFSCSSKHGGLCIWCLDEIPDRLLWQKKFTFLLFLGPLLFLFLPAPVPIVAFLGRNLNLWWVLLAYGGLFTILFFIARAHLRKKIMNSIPERELGNGYEKSKEAEVSNQKIEIKDESIDDVGIRFLKPSDSGHEDRTRICPSCNHRVENPYLATCPNCGEKI